MKAVFLVGSYVPHQLTSINSLIDLHGVEIYSFSISKNFKYIPEKRNNFTPYMFGDYGKTGTLNKIKNIKPDIVVTAGWMIPEYNWVCKQLKKSSTIPIVAMSDTPWYGTLKQKINTIIAPFHVKKAFTHLWVAGIRQYDYARKLGFSNMQIVFNSLSADVQIFEKVDIESKVKEYPKNFIYIGNYLEIKGLKNLISSWGSIVDKKGWTFTLIGAGELKDELIESGNFIVKDYMPQEKLLNEMREAGCFVLPSLSDQWALVLHEAAAAGLPIICTETCGAAPHFVINNYNGYRIKDNDKADLKHKMEMIINSTEEKLFAFSHSSRKLSQSITPEIQTASIMQLLYDKI